MSGFLIIFVGGIGVRLPVGSRRDAGLFIHFYYFIMKNNRLSNQQEFPYHGLMVNGFVMLFFTFILIPALIMACWVTDMSQAASISLTVVLAIVFVLGTIGYIVQEPNESRVMIFFGKYVGTIRRSGYLWVNPFVSRKKLSLRLRNMDIDPIKVNDKIGNPVLIGMVLVWKINDTYKVVFDLDSQSLGASGGIDNMSLDHFVRTQSDAALREVTSRYAYDRTDDSDESVTLRDGGEEINHLLEVKINERLKLAGLEVVEARLNYLAYAPEIAAVMLRRQQAAAIITAREKIVEGAVSMVKMALDQIEAEGIVKLDENKKADMVGNLLMILCGDDPAQPVINAQ